MRQEAREHCPEGSAESSVVKLLPGHHGRLTPQIQVNLGLRIYSCILRAPSQSKERDKRAPGGSQASSIVTNLDPDTYKEKGEDT